MGIQQFEESNKKNEIEKALENKWMNNIEDKEKLENLPKKLDEEKLKDIQNESEILSEDHINTEKKIEEQWMENLEKEENDLIKEKKNRRFCITRNNSRKPTNCPG